MKSTKIVTKCMNREKGGGEKEYDKNLDNISKEKKFQISRSFLAQNPLRNMI